MFYSSILVSANCTINCISTRRQWPKLDFEFYYEHSGDGPPMEFSLLSYSVLNSDPISSSSSVFLTPSFSVSFTHFDSSSAGLLIRFVINVLLNLLMSLISFVNRYTKFINSVGQV